MSLPTAVYPLYENAFRAHRHQTVDGNDKESARLYADFAGVAASQPCSWTFGENPADENSIRQITRKNRMINSPCE